MRLYLGDNVNGWRLIGIRIGRVYCGVSISIDEWGAVTIASDSTAIEAVEAAGGEAVKTSVLSATEEGAQS